MHGMLDEVHLKQKLKKMLDGGRNQIVLSIFRSKNQKLKQKQSKQDDNAADSA